MLSSRAARTRALWHLAAGLLCATLSVAAAVYVDRSEHLHDRQHFLDESARLQQQILRRFEVHEELLQGAAGLFAVSGDVDEAQWRTYMGGLDLSRHLPGLDAVACDRRSSAACPRSGRGTTRNARRRGLRRD